jgi:hypothetical protein
MKKIVFMFITTIICSGMVCALDFTTGARVSLDIAAGTAPYCYTTDEPNIGGGIGVYCNIGFAQAGNCIFGIQPEVDMYFNNGLCINGTGTDSKGNSYTEENYISGNTIDIPLIFTYTLLPGKDIRLGFGTGPYISIPTGYKSSYTYNEENTTTNEYSATGVNAGEVIDVNCAFKAGIGNIVADLRYLIDFDHTKDTGNDDSTKVYYWYTRRSLNLGAGYEIKF